MTEHMLHALPSLCVCVCVCVRSKSHFHIKSPLMHTFIIDTIFVNTVSLLHVSVVQQPSSGCMTDMFQQQGQQNELPDVKFWKSACFVDLDFEMYISYSLKMAL